MLCSKSWHLPCHIPIRNHSTVSRGMSTPGHHGRLLISTPKNRGTTINQTITRHISSSCNIKFQYCPTNYSRRISNIVPKLEFYCSNSASAVWHMTRQVAGQAGCWKYLLTYETAYHIYVLALCSQCRR